MTLVLTVAAPNYVLQASDRRLTLNAKGLIEEHDTSANKALVFDATDGVATLAYSGIAYIGSTPTDEWISQGLWDGEPVRRSPDGIRPTAMTMGNRGPRYDIGTLLFRLQKRIEAALGLQSALLITATGWQWDRRGFCRPFVIELEKVKGDPKVRVERTPRYFTHLVAHQFHSIGAPIAADDISQALAPFHAARKPPTPGEMESLLIGLIRQTGAGDATVGPDVTTVLLPHPCLGGGYSAFHPVEPVRFHAKSGRLNAVLNVHCTPWVIGGGVRSAPAYAISDSIVPLGHREFTIRGGPPSNGIAGLTFSMHRKPRPGSSAAEAAA